MSATGWQAFIALNRFGLGARPGELVVAAARGVQAVCLCRLGIDEMTVENRIFPDSRSAPAASDLLLRA